MAKSFGEGVCELNNSAYKKLIEVFELPKWFLKDKNKLVKTNPNNLIYLSKFL